MYLLDVQTTMHAKTQYVTLQVEVTQARCLQAKVAELDARVAEQQQGMGLLLQDKSALESRVQLLLRVLQMRDEEIERLRTAPQVSAKHILWAVFQVCPAKMRLSGALYTVRLSVSCALSEY